MFSSLSEEISTGTAPAAVQKPRYVFFASALSGEPSVTDFVSLTN